MNYIKTKEQSNRLIQSIQTLSHPKFYLKKASTRGGLFPVQLEIFVLRIVFQKLRSMVFFGDVVEILREFSLPLLV